MTEAQVNEAARQDTVGVMLRQKQTLDRVSAVLCDGLDWTEPAEWWRRRAAMLDTQEDATVFAAKCRAIADLIDELNL